jgi:CRISPR-associated protein Cas5t
MISKYQPTLRVPPLSTINGLISSAKGSIFGWTDEKIGYVFFYETCTTDLETIYQIPIDKKNKPLNTEIKSNVINREFLSDFKLFLYTNSEEITGYFKEPAFQLLLGRSGDLANVQEIKELDVAEKETLDKITGTIIPFSRHKVAGAMQALPVSFSDEIPRRNIGTQPYSIIDQDSEVRIVGKGFRDDYAGKKWDVYWQEV